MTYKSYQEQKSLSSGLSWGKLNLFYNLFWVLSRLFSRLFLRIEVKSIVDLKNIKGPLIVASNHISWADGFLVGSSFPLRSNFSPVRYAVFHKYYYFPLFRPFLWLIGCFPVKKGIGLEKSLKVPTEILNQEGVVGIFPEGKRGWKEGPSKPKRGVAYLAFTTGAKILPVRIQCPVVKMKFWRVITRQYKIKIKIGKPFKLPSKEIKVIEDYNQPANYVINRIRQL